MTTLAHEILEVLAGVGLGENEARVYLAALELGPSTVWEIAKKSGVKRPTCYFILDTLIFRGLASKTTTPKAAHYLVISPKQLIQRTRVRQQRLEKHLEQLDGLASQSHLKPAVRFYEGLAGLKEAYGLGLEEPKGSTILVYATAAVVSLLPEFVDWYFAEKKKRGILTHVIFADTPENRAIAKRDVEHNRLSRLLPRADFDPTVEMNLFGNTLLYAAHSEREPFATVIENPAIAQLERQAFHLLWQKADQHSPAMNTKNRQMKNLDTNRKEN